MGRYGDGIGTGPDLRAAGQLAVEAALRPLAGRAPDLAVVFVSGHDPGAMAEVAVECGRLSGAGTVLGCTAAGVVGAGRAVEGTAAVSVLLAVLPGAVLRTFHLEVMPVPEGAAVVGMPELSGADEVAVLLADPWSFPTGSFVQRAATALPGLPLVGGLAHGASAGATRMWVDGRVVERGAVGVLVSGASARPLLSQGCRPVGPAMTVTSASGNVLRTLAGVPAVERVRQVLAALPPAEQALASAGLQIGVAADEYAEEHEFLVRTVMGTEPETGGLVVGDLVEVGQTVRLQVRDAETATADLRDALARCPGQPGSGALLFSCAGRGAALFGDAAHDVRAVRAGLAADAVAGCFAGGEIGPVAGRSALHGFTASVLVLP